LNLGSGRNQSKPVPLFEQAQIVRKQTNNGAHDDSFANRYEWIRGPLPRSAYGNLARRSNLARGSDHADTAAHRLTRLLANKE